MAEVFLSLGSNIEPRRHLAVAVKALRMLFDDVNVSPVYESEAVGFDGDNFLNLVLSGRTSLSPGQLDGELKGMETRLGRRHEGPKFSARTLDIDILTYDNLVGEYEGVTLPREEILEHAFVLRPLADLAPHAIHPVTGQTFIRHWQELDQSRTGQRLRQVELSAA